MDDNREETAVAKQMTDELYRPRTTIGLKRNTKGKLDRNRAQG